MIDFEKSIDSKNPKNIFMVKKLPYLKVFTQMRFYNICKFFILFVKVLIWKKYMPDNF